MHHAAELAPRGRTVNIACVVIGAMRVAEYEPGPRRVDLLEPELRAELVSKGAIDFADPGLSCRNCESVRTLTVPEVVPLLACSHCEESRFGDLTGETR